MSVDRPTFHESWYRVAQLRPRLLCSVQVHRQHFRGQMWYVLENPANNEFSRLSVEAHHFVGLLDGRRTVADVWRICNERLGDKAPTQGEVIQLLGQLYSSNLLYAELAPDTEGLFNRYRTRVKRQIQGFLTNLLFIRIPLLDPDHILERWVGVVGWLFSWIGLILWLTLMTGGLYFVVGNIRELIHQSSDILAPDNLILLYLSIVIIKVCHEFGHAFACKRFGRLSGTGGQVHVMGVMFLVFVPLPYVDASSAWAFRKKWHRAVVGMSGVMVELAGAAILVEQAYEQLEIRVKGRPEVLLPGQIEAIFPAGHEVLPSEALGYAVGGSMPTIVQDPSGVRTAEKFFEIRIRPTPDSPVRLLSGQRVVARIQLPSKPLAAQWWRSARQLFQRRFRI